MACQKESTDSKKKEKAQVRNEKRDLTVSAFEYSIDLLLYTFQNYCKFESILRK